MTALEELDAQERRHDFIRLRRGSQKKAFREGKGEAAIAAATDLALEAVAKLRSKA